MFFLKKNTKFNKIYSILNHKYAFFIGSFILAFILMKNVVPLDGVSDDQIFMNGINDLGVFNWINQFYNQWSGRITMATLNCILLNCPIILWRGMNAFFYAMLFHGIISICDIKRLSLKLIVIFSVFSLSVPTISSSSFWMTGSTVYLWPMSASLYFLIYFKGVLSDKVQTNRFYIICILMTFIGCYNELIVAVCAVLLILSVIYKIYMKKKYTKYEVIFMAFFIINSIILFIAPGNYVRSFNEMIQWNSSFEMYSLFEKIWSGIYSLLFYTYGKMKIHILILMFIGAYFAYKNKDWRQLTFTSLPTFYLVLKYIFEKMIYFNPYNTMMNNIYYYIYGLEFYSIENYNIIQAWIAVVLGCFILTTICYVVMNLFKEDQEMIFYTLILLASFCTVIVMGFTPTLNASGSRIYYVFSMLFIIVLSGALNKVKNKYIILCVLMIFAYLGIQNMIVYLQDGSFLYLF